VKHPLLLSDFNQTWAFSTDFRKKCNCQISAKSVQRESNCSVQTDMKLRIAFRNFANAPKIPTRRPGRTLYMCSVSGLFRRFGLVSCLYFQSQRICSGECANISQQNPSECSKIAPLLGVKTPKHTCLLHTQTPVRPQNSSGCPHYIVEWLSKQGAIFPQISC
jgi:hypothetical protein